MILSEVEKKEMLEDGRNKERMLHFRKGRHAHKKMSFEEYIDWLQEMRGICRTNTKKKFFVYKNVKI